jgi:hypothetical protein
MISETCMLLPTHPLPPLAVLCLELGYTLVTFYSLSTVVGYLLWLNEDTPSIFIEGDTP